MTRQQIADVMTARIHELLAGFDRSAGLPDNVDFLVDNVRGGVTAFVKEANTSDRQMAQEIVAKVMMEFGSLKAEE